MSEIEHSPVVIAGLTDQAQARYVSNVEHINKIIAEHFMSTFVAEDLENVAIAASNAAGQVGNNAPPGDKMRQAHSKGTEELNRLLSRHGEWKPIRSGHLRYAYNSDANIIIFYRNVDCAADRNRLPKNNTGFGSETTQLITTPVNYTFPIFPPAPQVWFLCCSFDKDHASDNMEIELSLPILKNNYFSGFEARLAIKTTSDPITYKTDRYSTPPIDNSFDSELGDLDLDLRTG
ncbi:hypothetical protein [Kushneria aurantia]|uniref:Uncharacterized protein n=1 Tax=Kushneria aurantia TaxID=504092 RepID=A0ABV6G4G1_9GAMM|nr:hypothetical protein [Kushneria aurantia]